MNLPCTFRVLGGLLLFLGGLFLAPLPFAVYHHDGQVPCFLGCALAAAVAGILLLRAFRGRAEPTPRDGFAIVTLGWLTYVAFGGLPYLCSGSLPSPVDAWFASMSGFTTCGASVFRNVEVVPPSILFWRALTQFVGGMGIIVLGVAVLPLLGVGGMKLYEAESPGPTADRLTPRIRDTARLVWSVYAGVTLAGTLLLWLGDMPLLDALCHAFAAVSTGGFSTRNASLGAFGTYSQLVTVALMVVGGANFSLHWYAVRGHARRYWQSEEFRAYVATLAGAILVAWWVNRDRYASGLVNLRDATFTVTTILTTTGFATADFETWPLVVQALLVAGMFAGSCTGSTGGGIKHARLVLLGKHALQQTAGLVQPRRVWALRLDPKPVPADVVQDVLGFVVLFLAVFVVAGLLLTAAGVDLVTAASGTIACLSTVGPGLGQVGPMDNYASLPASSKLVLAGCMLLGRLEVYTVLVLFLPSFWRRWRG